MISVIIPTYKPDYTLYECLDSLNKQTLDYDKFDVYLILNGEQFPYENEIREYMKNSKVKINYFYTSEKGVSNARNIGINNAKGEYITFIDSDDWVSEFYLQGLLENTNSEQMALAKIKCYDVTNKNFFDDYLGKLFTCLKNDVKYKHTKIRSYFSTPVGKLIPNVSCRSFYFSKQFSYGEDALYMFEIEPYLPMGVKASNNTIYYRRCTENSLSRVKRSKKEIIKIHLLLLKEYWILYLKNMKKYNILFFINRNLAILKHIILGK